MTTQFCGTAYSYAFSVRTLADVVAGIASDPKVSSLANSYGLAVNTVSWEDTGRSKGSCWGPNITDMTLRCRNKNMPVLRKPNFADVTADRSLDDFTVMVGNEDGSPLTQITLKEYLTNIQKYTDNTNIKNLLLDRDNTILTSAQACVLPLEDGQVEFCVQMYNYQSNHDSSDPAVLVIMSGAQGTSTQVVYGSTSIYLNDNNNAYNMRAERLTDDRKKRGVPLDGPMTDEEKNRNALFIYQIPLRQKPRPPVHYMNSAAAFGADTSNCCMMNNECDVDTSDCLEVPYSPPKSKRSRGFEKAVLSRGEYMGKFTGTNGLTLERDDRFPIRCTVQYYNVTDSTEITEAQIKEISETIANTYVTAQATGSLVFNKTDRPTESVLETKYAPPVPSSTPLVNFL